MTDNPFGALGGLMKGLSSFMPQDDPNVKVLNATTNLSDLEAKRTKLLASIGEKAYKANAANPAWADEADEIALIDRQIAKAKAELDTATSAQQQAEAQEKAASDARTCPECGTVNPEGVKFCQECGSKLGVAASLTCPGCGTACAPGTRFCGECGHRF